MEIRQIKKVDILFFICLISFGSKAQPVANLQEVLSRYPNENLVISKLKTTYEFILDANKPKVKTYNYIEYFYISEKALSANSHVYHYSPTFDDNVKHKAFVYNPNEKGKLKKKEIKYHNKATTVSSGVFYDDQKEVSFFYPGVKKGSFTTIEYESVLNEPRLLPAFYFHRGLVVLDAEFEITVPNYFTTKNIFVGDTTGINMSKEVKSDKTIYKWRGLNMSEFSQEPGSPHYSHYLPHVVCIPESFKDKVGNLTTILSSPKDLYKWYSKFVETINQYADKDLNAVVDSLVLQNPDTLNRIKAIYNWVQSNLKYVAFEDGMGGFIPREADLVFKRRYGDCKDMSSILYVMLRKAGINAYYTWIGTRDIAYSYYTTPSPLCDNHMISAVKYRGDWIFLDGTTTYLKFGYPSGFIQGKEALIGITKDSFAIVTVPEMNSTDNMVIDSMHIYIGSGNVKGNSNSTFTGYMKEDLMYTLAGSKNVKDPQAMSSLFEMGNNKFLLTEIGIKGMEDNNTKLQVDYGFEIPNYLREIEKEIYINLNFDKNFDNEFLAKEKRKTDREVNYKYTTAQHIVLHIPDGYELNKCPKNLNVSNDFIKVDLNYRQVNSTLVFDKSISLNTLLIKNKDFENWDSIISQLSSAYKEVITLQKK